MFKTNWLWLVLTLVLPLMAATLLTAKPVEGA
jgi:hypothetical protein